MKGIILLNGQPYTGDIPAENAYVVCCDGAYDWAKGRVKIDENVGDFDSLGYMPTPAPKQIYPAEKDFTDGEIALKRLLSLGVETIEIYGGGGGREDHFLGNLHLLYAALGAGVHATMITEYSRIYPATGRVEFLNKTGKTVSVLPFGGSLHIMGSKGLKYPEPPCITYGQCIGISNVVLFSKAWVEIADGDIALIIENGGNKL